MIEKKSIDWIKSKRFEGHSEELLKKELSDKGYDSESINEAISFSKISSKLGFIHYLSQKGAGFVVLFCIILCIFIFELIAVILASIFKSQFIVTFLLIILGGLMFYYLKKCNFYAVLILLFLFSPLGLLLLSLLIFLNSFVLGDSSTFYVFISIHTFVLGLISAFMFDKVRDTFNKYLKTEIILSSVLAIVFAINAFIKSIMLNLSAQMSALQNISSAQTNSLSLPMFNLELFDINIGFILGLIFFNIPYIIFILKRKSKTNNFFLWYLIPILIFVLMTALLNFIVPFFLKLTGFV